MIITFYIHVALLCNNDNSRFLEKVNNVGINSAWILLGPHARIQKNYISYLCT